MARLVPATCPRCGAAVHVDPAVESVTCTYCGSSSFVQTPKRPPTERVIQARQPVIQVNASSELWPWFLLTVAVLGGLGALGVAAPGFLRALKEPQRTSASAPVRPAASVSAPAPPKPIPIFYEDASPIRWILEHHIGTALKLTSLTIYDRTLVANAQDPKHPTQVDRYFWANGAFDAPTPVVMDEASLKKALFDLSELDFALVPKISADALATAKIAGAKVSHIIVERRMPSRKNVVWRVYVGSERESEVYAYSLEGKRLR